MTVTVIILSVAIFAFLIGVSAGIAIASGRGKTKEEQDREDKAQVSFCNAYTKKKKAHIQSTRQKQHQDLSWCFFVSQKNRHIECVNHKQSKERRL